MNNKRLFLNTSQPKLFRTFLAIFLIVSLISCRKDANNNGALNTDFNVTNTWEATIDGVEYKGTVDTSFLHIHGSGVFTDTIVYCTGTSFDKKANISFKIRFNRTSTRSDLVSTASSAANFMFDTSSKNYLRSYHTTLADLTFKLDSINGTKIKGRFYGKVYDPNTMGPVIKDVTNGKFSFSLFKGSNEPKNFAISVPDAVIPGYIKNARHISNTLVFDGFTFSGDTSFKVMVRTGSKITTGMYYSRNGDVGLQVYRPSFYPFYVTDTLGNLAVQITNVSGDIVEGLISGTSRQSFFDPEMSITNGKFRCRVKNYIPGQDSINRWTFCDESGIKLYSTYGGNITSAAMSKVSYKHILKITGESDRGSSSFNITVSANSPITTGVYEGGGYPKLLDSLSFRSSLVNYFKDRNRMFVVIDTLDNQRVVGRFFETDPYNGSYGTIHGIRKGYFRAKF